MYTDFNEFTGAMCGTRIKIYGTCLTVAGCLHFTDVITVGNANTQEVVLAIKALMNFSSAEEHHSAFAKAYLFAMYIGS